MYLQIWRQSLVERQGWRQRTTSRPRLPAAPTARRIDSCHFCQAQRSDSPSRRERTTQTFHQGRPWFGKARSDLRPRRLQAEKAPGPEAVFGSICRRWRGRRGCMGGGQKARDHETGRDALAWHGILVETARCAVRNSRRANQRETCIARRCRGDGAGVEMHGVEQRCGKAAALAARERQ